MTFINERIPEQELRNLDMSKFMGPLGSWTLRPWSEPWWTIDRERDVFLVCTGIGGRGGADEPRRYWFALSVNGDVVHFEADEEITVDPSGQRLAWRQGLLHVPESMRSRRAEFVQLLTAALSQFGMNCHPEWVYRVDVDVA